MSNYGSGCNFVVLLLVPITIKHYTFTKLPLQRNSQFSCNILPTSIQSCTCKLLHLRKHIIQLNTVCNKKLKMANSKLACTKFLFSLTWCEHSHSKNQSMMSLWLHSNGVYFLHTGKLKIYTVGSCKGIKKTPEKLSDWLKTHMPNVYLLVNALKWFYRTN